MNRNNIKEIKKFLKTHSNFLICAHVGPEGDSLGAQLAFSRAIKVMGKRCDIVNAVKHSREYAFLPSINSIKTRPKIKKYDAAIILDCSDISRVGNVSKFINKNIPILNIDHHISNALFGDINLVKANASSTCEMLFLLFKECNIKIDKLIAIYLYTGILTDTGSFRYTNTSSTTHRVVSELMKFDINAQLIFRNVYENLSFSELKLINGILSNLNKDSSGKIAWAKITQDLLKKYNPQTDFTDNILNFVRAIKGIEVSILFREMVGEGNNIRVNLRSKGRIDVNKIAQHFGGGGHKTASGITLRNISINKAEAKIINFIKRNIN